MFGIGIIGCGKIAQVRHIPEYAENQNAKLVGFYDINLARVQEQFGEKYRLEKDGFLGWVLMDYHKDAWRQFYSFTEEPQLMVDYIAPNFYCEKHPDSPFNKNEMFSLKTPQGRITLDGRIFKEFQGEEVTVLQLSDEDLANTYQKFGLSI